MTHSRILLPSEKIATANDSISDLNRRAFKADSVISFTKTKHEINSFTLTEMLVVLGIMGILMYIGLPAFTKLAKGYGLEAAARNMVSAIKLTRDRAITENQYVALLIPHRDAPGTGSGFPEKYIHRAYRLCIVNGMSSAAENNHPRWATKTFTFVRWIQGDAWQFVPDGIAILEYDQEKDIGPDSHDGTADDGPDCIEYLCEDSNPHEEVDGVDCSDIGGPSSVNNVLAVVFKPTGEIPSLQRYMSIGEAVYSNGSLQFTNKQPYIHGKGIIQLKVDAFTGRVSYGTK